MKTREELLEMNVTELRTLAGTSGVKNYVTFTKELLVDEIVKAQTALEGRMQQEDLLKETNTDFTDRHEKVINVDDRAHFRVGAKWFPGTITKLKIVDKEQYAVVMLDGHDAIKMFHTTDIDAGKTPIAPTAPVIPDSTSTENGEEVKTQKKASKKEPGEKTQRILADKPKADTISEKVYELLMAGMERKLVAAQLKVSYQFVRSIDVRYCKEN